MQKEFNVIIEQDDDGFFVASVPELHGCHTQAKSLDVLMERIKEAIELCLEVQDAEFKIPRFVGIQRMTGDQSSFRFTEVKQSESDCFIKF